MCGLKHLKQSSPRPAFPHQDSFTWDQAGVATNVRTNALSTLCKLGEELKLEAKSGSHSC